MSLCSLVEKIEINAPLEKVFEFFSDTDQFSRTLTSVLPLKLIRRTTRHLMQGSSFYMETRVLGRPFQFHSHVHSMSRNRHIAHLWRGDLKTAWEQDDYFESIPGNRTRVTTCILYYFPFGFLGKVGEFILLRPCLKWLLSRRRAALRTTFLDASWQKVDPPNQKSSKDHPSKSTLYLPPAPTTKPTHR